MYVADYELYPELTNTGVEMKDVPEEAFAHEIVAAQNGQQYDLLRQKDYPYCVLQIDKPKDMEEFRLHLNNSKRQGWAEYVKGRYDHLVMNRGNWQHLDINQDNAQYIADLIHDAIRNGARWWVKFRGDKN